ncbi:MAG TPA: MATE family efflux transporter [Bryobacteraceae bacterium]|nr:MATE family efflux transporter [Bryobacteraceae bacterium]
MPEGASPPPVSPGFSASVREALRGSRQDYTEGSPDRAILLLAIPMILEMVMESLFGIVDAFFVSSLGTDAVAAVALTESLLILLFGVAIGLSMATTAMVARRIGEKDPEGAAVAAAQSIFVGIFLALITAILGYNFAPVLLRFMGASAAVIRTGENFARMIFSGSITIFLLFLNNAIFRGAGDAAIAMRVLWVANILNIVLNPCLILGLGPFPQLGLLGSAVGTTIGRGSGVLIQFWVLFGGMSRIRLNRSHLHIQFDILWRLLRVSLTGILQFLISTASWMGVLRVIAEFGSATLAGYMLSIRMIMFAILPAWGLCNASATLVGQSLGAKKPGRAEQAVYRAGFFNMYFLGFVALIFIFFAPRLLHIFSQDPEVIRAGSTCLRTICSGYLFYAWGMVTMSAFNGAGDTFTPLLINLGCLWVLQIPLAWLLAFHWKMGAQGVFLAILCAQCSLAVVGLTLFRRGAWKRQKI